MKHLPALATGGNVNKALLFGGREGSDYVTPLTPVDAAFLADVTTRVQHRTPHETRYRVRNGIAERRPRTGSSQSEAARTCASRAPTSPEVSGMSG